jgi:two-component sensor histidine kinase
MSEVDSVPGQPALSLRDVLESLPAAVYVTDPEGRVLFYNRAMVELTGNKPEPGTKIWPAQLTLYLPDGTPLPYESMVTSADGVEVLLQNADGERTPIIAYADPIHCEDGSISGAVNLLVDISNRKEAEARSRALLSQFIHREKNEIQTIQSLLTGAQREAQNEEAKEVLAHTVRRVGAIAAVQNVVDRAGGKYPAQGLLEVLCRHSNQSFGRKLDIRAEPTTLSLPNGTALPLAIIINELVSNSVEHGGGERNHVAVRISLSGESSSCVLMVQDDGPGFKHGTPKHRASGLGLVEGLARQLGGKLEVTADQGARCVVRFRESAG